MSVYMSLYGTEYTIMNDKVYILGGLRSYIGVENGMYKHIPAEKLGAEVLKEVIDKYNISKPDYIIGGNGVGAGGNITRLMMLEAGVPYEVPAYTVDMQCGSALETMAIAAAKIKSGQADIIVAGGFESSSTAPGRRYNKNHPDYEKMGGEESWYKVAKFIPETHDELAMLRGAEKTAVTQNITREEMNPWVIRSHNLAKTARESGILDDITVEVADCGKKDEGIRDRMNQRLLDRLPCVLKDVTRINAANACLTNDGAAWVVMCSERYVQQTGQKPAAQFLDAVSAGSDPSMSPMSVVCSIDKLLEKNRLDYMDIDIYECNEAFAVIDVLFERKYPKACYNYNIFGGALAYGHPYGASGAIITLHAIKALEKTSGRYAVCSIAAAGGIGTAVLLEKCDSLSCTCFCC